MCKGKYDQSSEYQLLIRVVSEQTNADKDGKLSLETKNDKALNSSMLQNPSDPEATFKVKAGKEYRGYVANFVETVGEDNSIISNYGYEQNIHSDSAFFKESLNNLSGTEENEVTVVTDGAYGGIENIELAKQNNVILVTTNMQGKKDIRYLC